jgi:hypothetical protein
VPCVGSDRDTPAHRPSPGRSNRRGCRPRRTSRTNASAPLLSTVWHRVRLSLRPENTIESKETYGTSQVSRTSSGDDAGPTSPTGNTSGPSWDFYTFPGATSPPVKPRPRRLNPRLSLLGSIPMRLGHGRGPKIAQRESKDGGFQAGGHVQGGKQESCHVPRSHTPRVLLAPYSAFIDHGKNARTTPMSLLLNRAKIGPSWKWQFATTTHPVRYRRPVDSTTDESYDI